MPKINMGDRVMCIDKSEYFSPNMTGRVGTVVDMETFYRSHKAIGIDFGYYIGGSTLEGKCERGCGCYLEESILVKLSK